MPEEIMFGILFGGLALLAQYLPKKIGIPLGILAVILSIWQLGWVGWPLALAIVLTALLIWRIFASRGLLEKKPNNDYSKKWQHYKKLVKLFTLLKTVSREDREKVLNDISLERVEFDDKELQEWIDKFLDAEDECVVHHGLKMPDFYVRRVITMTRERMNKRYKG